MNGDRIVKSQASKMQNPPVAETNNNGEAEKQISEAFYKRLGGMANFAAELEGGIEVSKPKNIDIIITEADKTNVDNDINTAVKAKVDSMKLGKIPVVNSVIMAGYRAIAASAVRKAGGDTEAAFKALDVEPFGGVSKGAQAEAARRARLALSEGSFDDGVMDANNSLVLNAGEKIEKVKDGAQENLNSALKNLFNEISEAKEHGDDEALDLAKQNYQKQIDDWQEKGTFGQNEGMKDAGVFGKIGTFLVGDHSKKSMTQLDALREMGKAVEDLAKENIAQKDFDKYVDEHVSLYNASMKEGVYTKQVVNNITAAVAAGGVAGALAYTALGFGRGTAKTAVIKEAAQNATQEISNAALGAAVGGAFGAAAGAVRGINTARVKMSEAEIKAATSAEAIEPEAKVEEAKVEEIKAEEVPVEENAVVENEPLNKPAEKVKFSDILGKINKVKKTVTGEDKYKEAIEEKRDRKSAKELYDELNDSLTLNEIFNMTDAKARIKRVSELKEQNPELFNKIRTEATKAGRRANSKRAVSEKAENKFEEKYFKNEKYKAEAAEALADILAEIRARNQVSSEQKIDLIKYSEGNIDKERRLLAEKIVEAGKLVDREKLSEKIQLRATELAKANKSVNGERGKFIARQAIADAIVGGMIGSAFGAVAGYMKDVRGAKLEASDTEAPVDVEAGGETEANAGITFEDRDGDGTLAVYDAEGKAIISEKEGLHFDEETGKISSKDLALLKERGVDIKELEPKSEMMDGGYTKESVENYFSKDNANYVENVDANSGEIDAGNTVTDIERSGWVTTADGNRAADVIVGQEPVNEGDIVLQVVSHDEAVDVDDLQVVLTASKEMNDMGIVLDVAEDGTVTIPADSAAASMFAEGTGSFAGRSLEVVREAASGDGYEVLSTNFGSNTLENVGFTAPVEKLTYMYEINGESVSIPEAARAGYELSLVGAESMRDSGGVEYTSSTNRISVNGLAADDDSETFRLVQRSGNYSEVDDPFFSAEKEAPALSGENMVRKMVGANESMTDAEADAALIEAVNTGQITTGDVVNEYLEQAGNSPEQITTMRAMLGDFEFDVDGDGTAELIDTAEEINAVADILKDSAEPEGYSAFVNDTYELLAEKLDGGEIRLVNYVDEPYEYTTLGYLDEFNNVIQKFARKINKPNGVGIEFLDKDGKSVFDLNVAKRIWKLSSNASLDRVTARLNCGQPTADVHWVQRVVESTPEPTPETVQEPTNPTPTSTSSTTPTSTPSTPSTPTTPVNPTPSPEPTPTPTPNEDLAPKTATNPWAGDNPTQLPVTENFEAESAANNGARIVQAGEEMNVPVENTEGVNLAPEAQQDWAEEATAPVRDTGTGGLVDMSASSDAEAAQMLKEAEAAVAAEQAAKAATEEALEQEGGQ